MAGQDRQMNEHKRLLQVRRGVGPARITMDRASSAVAPASTRYTSSGTVGRSVWRSRAR